MAPCAALLLAFHTLAATSAASPHGKVRRPPVGLHEGREIVITDKVAKGLQVIRAAPGFPATLFFPESFVGDPSCADCDEKLGLFRLEPSPSRDSFSIKPRKFPGRQRDGSVITLDDFTTIVTVKLQHYTLLFKVEFVENPALADARVVFTLPDRKDETAFVQQARRSLEKDAAEKVKKAEASALMKSLLEPHSCSTLDDRARADDLVLEATELCTFGPHYFLRFSVRNRSQDPIDLRTVQFRAGPNKKNLADVDPQQLVEPEHLEFKGQANGIVSFDVDQDQRVPRVFELVVQETNSPRTVSLTLTP